MYRPNFCADCGERVLRERWRPWTSNRFCLRCETRFRRQVIGPKLILIAALAGVALATAYRAGRSADQRAPLLIERKAPVPVATLENGVAQRVEEAAWICGARTKKGAPCSRRVHAPDERCWQHRGKRAVLAPEKRRAK